MGTQPEIVSAEEWRAARLDQLAKEKEFTRARDALAARRRRLPMTEVTEDYRFTGPAGEVGLADLFEGRRQLLVYHFMFEPDWDAGCPSCSFVADNIGPVVHLHARDTTLALVSRAPYDKLAAYRKRMGCSSNRPMKSANASARYAANRSTTSAANNSGNRNSACARKS